MKTTHTITIDESQRQCILLALAELSIAEMFDQFRRNHSNPVAEVLRSDPSDQNYAEPAYPTQSWPGP